MADSDSKIPDGELLDRRTAPFFWISREIEAYGLSAKAFSAYVSLVAHTRNEKCAASIPGLAKYVGLGETAFRAGLRELEAKRMIRVTRRCVNGHNLPNQYTILKP